MNTIDERRAELCRRKIKFCVRHARFCRRESWNQENSRHDRKEFRRMADEAINDVCGARWWRRELQQATTED